MPLHLESITNQDHDDLFMWIVGKQLDGCEDAFVTQNRLFAHCSKDITDTVSGEKIGEFVFTIKTNLEKQANEILDIDITFRNPSDVKVNFSEKLKASSESNEYYNAETEQEAHFQLETVNRYLIEEDISGKTYSVNLSAFPFKLSLYNDMKDLNTQLGFAEKIKAGNTDISVSGFSETFIATSHLFKENINSEETFSVVIGKITKIQNCRIEMNNDFCDFILAQLETALGNLTTVINPDRYDVEKIATGKFICMQADIKANFKLDEKYPRPVVKENPKRSFWDKLKSFFR